MKKTDLKLYDFSRLDADLNSFDQKGRRQSGLHVSGLVRAAFKNLKNTEPKPIEGEQPFVRTMAGFLWERSLENAFTEYMGQDRKGIVKQEGYVKDDVHGTPDGVADDAIEEYKCTWRSMKKWEQDPEENFWMWFAQVKAYCYMAGKNKARFFIFWVNGDYSYKTARGPQVTTAEFEFTNEELEDNWRVLLAHKDLAIKEG